jgi:(p)ppGpp synthase/HD superfamily hydrolase
MSRARTPFPCTARTAAGSPRPAATRAACSTRAGKASKSYKTAVRVLIGPRPNVLADITNALRPMNVEILHANYGPGDSGLSIFDFVFETTDQATVERVLRTLRTVGGVSDVTTLDSRERISRRYAHAG